MSDNVYEGKSLEDLLKDINEKTGEKRVYIKTVIEKIMKVMDNGSDDSIVVVGPIIKDYLELLTHVDEHYIKLATIVQRIISAKAYSGADSSNSVGLSEEEKDALYKNVMTDLNVEMTKLDMLDEKTKSIIN